MSEWVLLGEILVAAGDLSASVRDIALSQQQAKPGRRLGDLLLTQKSVTPLQLARALACQSGLPLLETIPPETSLADLGNRLSLAYLKDLRIFPLGRQEDGLHVAVADPYDSRPRNDLAILTGERILPVVAPADEILRAINRDFERRSEGAKEMVEEIAAGDNDSRAPEPEDLLDVSDEAPVIRFVNSLITQGYKERASDIHIEPFETELIVRYRIDGILYEALRPPHKSHAAIVSRIKIMAALNIAEKRLPQDGRFRVRIAGKDVDVRVSTLPTAFGERVVLRLLDHGSQVLQLEDIGLEADLLRQLDAMIRKSHGIFLVTGPTGSGKTTTLYAALTRLNNREKNIITVEDPIEYQLPGVGQIQVNAKIDLTFANGLRSILRQDPDIIMVGEIRDAETAEIAVQSALTGHMVFSTLHTNDAAGALTRLVEMGIEPFLAASSIVGIIAQRLVRQICPHCRESYHPSPNLLADAGLPNDGALYYRGRGCERCMGLGYRGRSGIYELLPVEEETRELLLARKDAATIKAAAQRKGMKSLRDAGLAKAAAGETTLEEVLRVTQEEV
ncbi:MAG: type II secretion system protein GspE [Deltaproteobacteria bacterium HGW-Deltaproteobacteria-4]|nr:MAG: type II secretion system protein GspE [Deltaproteobacteria bacterium HGW-Deltaproteobacteria-4]